MGRKRKAVGSGSTPEATRKSARRSGKVANRTGSDDSGHGGAVIVKRSEQANNVSSGGELNLNPLLNEVILTNLFQFCPPETLKNCRLVCRKWRNESLSAWRSSSTLKLTFPKHTWTFYLGELTVNESKTTSVAEFLKYLDSDCKAKPYRKVHLANWEFEGELLKRPKTRSKNRTEEIWEKLRTHLTSLKLSNCEFGDANGFRQVIYRSCPNLRSLVLHSCNFQSGSDEDDDLQLELQVPPNEQNYTKPPITDLRTNLKSLSIHWDMFCTLPVSWLELLAHFPNLTSLAAKFIEKPGWIVYSSEDQEIISAILNAIKMIRRGDDRLLPIKKFTHDRLEIQQDPASKEVMELIQQLHLPINSVELHLGEGQDGYEGVSPDDIKNLLEQSSHSLATIVSYSHLPSIIPLGVEFGKLKILSMFTDGFTPNLGFIRNTPSLEKLTIRNGNFRETAITTRHGVKTKFISNIPEGELSNNFRLPGLTSLSLQYAVAEEDVRKLTKWMPRVKDLEMFLNNKQFAIVCQNWEGLETLQVFGQGLTDRGVTGMRRKSKKAAATTTSEPNIKSLQSLKTFRAEMARLTDDSIFDGFARLPNLRKISLWRSAIGDLAKKALRENNIDFYICDR